MRTASASVAPPASRDRLQVAKALAGLLGRGVADELARLRVECHLARAEEEVPGAHGVAVGADGGGRARGVDGLASLRAHVRRSLLVSGQWNEAT